MNKAAPRAALPRRWIIVAGAGLAVLVFAVLAARSVPRAVQPGSPGSTFPQAIPTAELLAVTADNRSIVAEADAARAANAALLLVPGALEPARSFAGPADPATRLRAETCLAQAMYYEAGFEGEQGRRAVAQVVLNRLRHPAFPHSVCDVVYQRQGGTCQFTFACDGALARQPVAAIWDKTLREAGEALAGRVEKSVGMATHYHADYVYPVWAPRLEKVAAIGHHQFYRWPLGWGRRGVFTAAYTGIEPGVLPMPPAMATETGSAEEAAMVAQGLGEVAPRRSDNDAGYVDPSKGWRPTIADISSEPAREKPE